MVYNESTGTTFLCFHLFCRDLAIVVMKTQSADTSPEIEQVQFEILRNMSVAQRVELGRGLIRLALRSARRAIQEAHPEANEQEIALIFIRQNYGEEIAGRLRKHLEHRG